MAVDCKQLVRDAYAAYRAGDRSFYEERLAEDFAFSAPPDDEENRIARIEVYFGWNID